MAMTKTIDDINLNQWFMQRELENTPWHFTKATTPITIEAQEWILDKLSGRFSLYTTIDKNTARDYGFEIRQYPAFEDPIELTLYELTWA
jgi:hypothetical protein